MIGNDTNETLDGNKILREQLQFYKKNSIRVHIEKKNGFFHNGYILEVEGDLLILDDKKLGAMPIHFIEIKILEKYLEKNGSI